jgi:hypothetical protein
MKKRGKKSPTVFPVAAAFQSHADETLRELASGAHIAEQYVREVLGEVSAANLRALRPEDRDAAAVEVSQRLAEGMSVGLVKAGLEIAVRKQRLALERKAKTAAGTEAERKRGAAATGAKRKAPWDIWRTWICKYFGVDDAAKVPSADKNAIIAAIVYRAGTKTQQPTLRVPAELPTLKGRDGKPPSDQSIRRNLFRSRAK